jgi:hypothetical protein
MSRTKTVYPKIGIWYKEADGEIHLSIEGQGLSTISSKPESERGNLHLFKKLAAVLRDAGVPHPPVE